MSRKVNVKFRKEKEKWRTRCVSFRSLAVVSSRKAAEEDTPLKYVIVFQVAKTLKTVKKDILRTVKDLLQDIFADMKMNEPITTVLTTNNNLYY